MHGSETILAAAFEEQKLGFAPPVVFSSTP
jgi:hypothetical protein